MGSVYHKMIQRKLRLKSYLDNMKNQQDFTSRRNNERYQNPRMEIEWRADGGYYRKSKLVNFSSSGLAVQSDLSLKPGHQVAFRLRLPGSVTYVLGEVRHSWSNDQDRTVAGVSLKFADERQEKLYRRRVRQLSAPRRSYETCQI